MRLDKIKLVGFKSFVDPTVVYFPKNLTGIVGPNGCGKSNIIDAIRWVMGESSAKQLRGESLTDVIFNGSTERKPVGQASVELIFNNSDHQIGGEYASYNEISIKRIVTRDSQSAYFLNNGKCRRRDIIDVFLGTGLGARSYSIIEQGMISRVIEAKPEELRAHFEEVAGISKYRERRRETENRIRHTRENLSRITDLRDEIGKQLERLKRQARAAERYKILKEEERLLKAEFIALKWRNLQHEADNFSTILQKQQTLLESYRAELQHIETEAEKQLSEKNQFSDEFNEIQGRYYRVGSEIARLEQAMAHHKDRMETLANDLEEVEQTWTQSTTALEIDRARIIELKEKITELTPLVEISTASTEKTQAALQDAEKGMQHWQEEWEKFNQLAAESSKLAQVELTRIEHLEEQQVHAGKRLIRIEEELHSLNIDQLKLELDEQESKLNDFSQQKVEISTDVDTLQQEITTKKSEIDHQVNQLNEVRDQLQVARGRLSSLEALQQAALGQEKASVISWLEKHQLHEHKRLAQEIKIEQGWEKALEAVLGDYLEAVCIQGMDKISSILSEFKEGLLSFFDINSYLQPEAARHGHELLSKKLVSKLPAQTLLDGIYAVEHLDQALALRDSLAGNESVVTKDGVWLGRNWLRLSKEQGAKAGVIQREDEIRKLNEEVIGLKASNMRIGERLECDKLALVGLEKQHKDASVTLSEIAGKTSDIKARTEIIRSQVEQGERRRAELKQEAMQHNDRINHSKVDLSKSRENWEIAMKAIEDDANRRDQLLAERDELRRTLDQAKQEAIEARNNGHQLELALQSNQTQLRSLEEGIERIDQQLVALKQRKEQLTEQLSNSHQPIDALETELQTSLEQRVAIEKELTQAKQHVDGITHQIQQLAQAKHEAENRVQSARNELEQKRLHGQEISIRQSTLQEQLSETDFVLENLLENLAPEATDQEWQEKIEHMAKKIGHLGAINLAAIEEFEEESERKIYLDAQHADLEEALNTLQNAIRKIDKETRQRFKDTFDTVNDHFKRLFPKVFGGGSAYLELTSDDLLETGVSVMAKPPGKKISSIHLLSGGEKALTAISLIFSMFHLNPAPFCLLDEVDAPLDDANVGRFCELVKEMAQKIQFLFISHNKVAIEMADHLTGVTMNEPGVSRIVAVDLDAAVAMAEA